MKKISILLITLLLTFGLMGCQLAEDVNIPLTNTEEIQEPSIPILFSYSSYDSSGEIDISEYIYYKWFLSDSFQEEYYTTGVEIGKSMEVIKSHTGINIVEVDDEVTLKEINEDFEANIYFGRAFIYDAIYPNVTYMNYEGETHIERMTGYGISRGVSIIDTYEIENFHGENWTIIVKLNFIILEDLQYIEVREFDESDNLIKTTMITEETILDELTLDPNTDYYFIMETYKDVDDNLYTERSFFNSDESVYHKYKFLNEAGFVYLDCLHVQESE